MNSTVFRYYKPLHVNSFSDEMVLVDSDDEEERKLLLSDSVTASPVQPRPGTDIGHVTGLDTCGPGRHVCPVPRLAWTSSDVSMSDNDKAYK